MNTTVISTKALIPVAILALKYRDPEVAIMLTSLNDQEQYSRWGNDTFHSSGDGSYYHNYKGLKQTEYPSIENMLLCLFGSSEEKEAGEALTKVWHYSSFLSALKDRDVFVDENGTVGFCDFKNKDFTEGQLEKWNH